jgi:hypothetical protein
MTLVKHHANETANVSDCRGGAWFTPTFDDIKRFHIRIEPSGFGRGQIEIVNAQFTGFAEKIVIDVSDVANTSSFMT